MRQRRNTKHIQYEGNEDRWPEKGHTKQKEANQNWYDRRYNEDATQRADAQRILTQTEESIRNRNRQAAGAQAVMGGTDESTAAAKAANAQALADATSQIAVNAENRKDQIEQTYQQRDSQINEALNNLEINKAQIISPMGFSSRARIDITNVI